VDSAAIPQFIAFLAKTLCGGKKADENLWLSSGRVVNRNGRKLLHLSIYHFDDITS
jgi:hypothetical protein